MRRYRARDRCHGPIGRRSSNARDLRDLGTTPTVIPVTAHALGLDNPDACSRVLNEVPLSIKRQRLSWGRFPSTVTCAAALTAALLVQVTQARAADARYLKGIVVAPPDCPGKPRPIADAVVHVRGAKDTPSTDEDGRFWLILPPEMKPGDALTIDADKEGYRLWLPSGGTARLPTDLDKNLLELQLVPVGSKRFLSPPAIEALVSGMMARAREQIGHDPHPGQIALILTCANGRRGTASRSRR